MDSPQKRTLLKAPQTFPLLFDTTRKRLPAAVQLLPPIQVPLTPKEQKNFIAASIWHHANLKHSKKVISMYFSTNLSIDVCSIKHSLSWL